VYVCVCGVCVVCVWCVCVCVYGVCLWCGWCVCVWCGWCVCVCVWCVYGVCVCVCVSVYGVCVWCVSVVWVVCMCVVCVWCVCGVCMVCVSVCVCVCVYMHTEGLNKASSRHQVEFSTLGPFLSKAFMDQRTNSPFSIYLPTHHIHPIQGILGSASSREAIEHNACVCVCVCVCALTRFSRVRLFATPWTVAHKAPLSMGFSRQKY